MAQRQRETDNSVPGVPEVPWASFLADHFIWRQGEHVSLIGPTGGGKTTLALGILHRRRYTVVLASKPRDRTLDALTRRGASPRYRRIRSWPPGPMDESVILWPESRDLAGARRRQQQAFHAAHQAIYQSGAWCIFADDMWFLCNVLKLGADLEMLYANGRSIGVSVVAGIQRPAHVPLMAYDQATHLFFWRDNDESNLRRIGGIGFADSRRVRQTVARLPRHVVLYVNSRTGEMVTTKAEKGAT